MRYQVELTSGETFFGYCNGKDYNGHKYITHDGANSGTKYSNAQIKSMTPAPKESKKTAALSGHGFGGNFGYCHKCHSYCFGDCEANE